MSSHSLTNNLEIYGCHTDGKRDPLWREKGEIVSSTNLHLYLLSRIPKWLRALESWYGQFFGYTVVLDTNWTEFKECPLKLPIPWRRRTHWLSRQCESRLQFSGAMWGREYEHSSSLWFIMSSQNQIKYVVSEHNERQWFRGSAAYIMGISEKTVSWTWFTTSNREGWPTVIMLVIVGLWRRRRVEAK